MPDIDTVLAIDPGRDKCGLAVVTKKGTVLYKTVSLRTILADKVYELVMQYHLEAIVLGDGTTSKETVHMLENMHTGMQKKPIIILIDEYRSTDEAKQRYWKDNPPMGWKKLIPVTLQTPPVPVDDYVAVILAERYFQS